ncbi:hypothetical protein ACFQ07_31520 [Actinomadura adrarensis]|uniref:Uncharacterized protein n=1 Tax=Actinomadura adrarensis TaxID=1819600 RepID=A0ABW3CTA1_9ACTN
MSKSRRWRLDKHGQVEPVDGLPVGTFTGQEWRAQQWPACPVCGSADAEPERIDVSEHKDRFPQFLIGAWECPNDCDPRPILRVRGLHDERPLRSPTGPVDDGT